MKTTFLIRRSGQILKNKALSLFNRIALPRMKSCLGFSDQKFLKKFNIPAVKLDLQRNNITAARNGLFEHFRRKDASAWPAFPSRMSDANDLSKSDLIKSADSLLSLRFPVTDRPEIHFPSTIDWTFNPSSDPRARWTRDLNRHIWWSVIAVAYQKTGDERYAHGLINIMDDWCRKNPPPSVKNEGDPVWTLMGVGMRSVIWASTFGILLSSPSFSAESALQMLKSIYDHAEFLYLFKTNNNHLLRECNGLATIGVYFPEFVKSEKWKDKAFKRLEDALINQVNTDGSHYELSTGYQWLVIDEFEGTWDLLQSAHTSFTKGNLTNYLKKMYSFLMYVSRPDGSIPQLNDGFMEGKEIQLRKLENASRKFGFQDILFVSTSGKEGSIPDETSKGFDDAGLYVMRSSWRKDSHYLIFDCGPFGGHHGHEDKLSFEISVFGYPFIVDPGTYTYNVADPYRAYFMSSRSHNTVTIRGGSQIRRQKIRNLNPVARNDNHAQWIRNDGFDYVQSDYKEGYGDFRFFRKKEGADPSVIEGVIHTRSILYVKSDYWILHDKIESPLPLSYEILFHMDPAIQCKIEDNKVVRLFRNGVYLNLFPISHCDFKIQSVFGGEAPIQGWYSNGKGKHKVPSPAIIFSTEETQKIDIITMIYPSWNQKDPIRVRFIKGNDKKNDSFQYRVEFNKGLDVIDIAKENLSIHTNEMPLVNFIGLTRKSQNGNTHHQSEWIKSDCQKISL
jgi:uncharacterized heparinase superfamily protein